jgi:hypothetical protein
MASSAIDGDFIERGQQTNARRHAPDTPMTA